MSSIPMNNSNIKPMNTEAYSSVLSSLPSTTNQPMPTLNTQSYIIIVLSLLLILSFLGINILDILSNIIKFIVNKIKESHLLGNLLGTISYATGNLLNKSADVVADTSKFAIDIAEGSIQDIGNLLIKASKQGSPSTPSTTSELSKSLKIETTNEVPTTDIPENPIQKPISSGKQNWCLIGEFDNKRKCVEMTAYDKCMSGQVYDSINKCVMSTIKEKRAINKAEREERREEIKQEIQQQMQPQTIM